MKNIKAILWDYDGTLVDSTAKNMSVTIDILRHFYPDIDRHLPEVLRSEENYQKMNSRYRNWRELYRECYNIPEDKIDEAGRLWTPCQLRNPTVPGLFSGLKEVLPRLAQYRMGICSQNGSENIRSVLRHYQVDEYFQAVIGYDDIPIRQQKPEPDGFLKCLEVLGCDPETDPGPDGGIFLYIGDHSEDMTFGKNAQRLLRQNGLPVSVICIAARYSDLYPVDWKTPPDYVIHKPAELENIILQL